jgi:acyl carrier protein
MMPCTAENVRQFILNHYAESWESRNLRIEDVPDTFDLLLEGLIDSLGVLELVESIEDAFDLELDLQNLDADQLTVIGALSKYVEGCARLRTSASSEENDRMSSGAVR